MVCSKGKQEEQKDAIQKKLFHSIWFDIIAGPLVITSKNNHKEEMIRTPLI